MVTKILRISHDDVIDVTISSTPNTLYVAFPVDADNVPDCLCPILITEDDGCDNLEICHCADDTELINSAAEVNVCHNSSTEQLTLYVRNVPPTSKNTRLHFYNSLICDGQSIIHYYTDSFEIRQGNKLLVGCIYKMIAILLIS